jgi:hypothetical protein
MDLRRLRCCRLQNLWMLTSQTRPRIHRLSVLKLIVEMGNKVPGWGTENTGSRTPG